MNHPGFFSVDAHDRVYSKLRQMIYYKAAGHPKILFGLRPKSLPKTGSLLIIVPVTRIALTKVKDKIVQLCILTLGTV